MSTALSCTRALVPRATTTAFRCRRFASTEAVYDHAAPPPPILSPPQRIKKKPEPLAVKMHRKLYPELYTKTDAKNWKPKTEVVTPRSRRAESKIINEKWTYVMKNKPVDTNLSLHHGIPIFPPTTPNIKKTCPNPIDTLTSSQLLTLDPSGSRTRLFARDNPESARVGDILLVRQRTGDPFAGVCISILRRGIDTAILLRGQLTRVGVEMWFKIYSPLVEGIEVVQRAKKRARRARLTYLRSVKHDRGSVEGVVRMYLRQRVALGQGGEGGKKKGDAAKAAMMGVGKKKKKGNARGKKR